MELPLNGCTPSATVKQCPGKDNHDRLMALYHTGTDVKRHLLQYYLSQTKRDLAGYLYGKYQFLPPDDIKRALRTKNIQLSDLGIYAIDALLSDQCFDLFWDSCLDKDKTSLENILNRYKVNLYRLYKTSGRDNNQSLRNERKWDYLSKSQWEYLYQGPKIEDTQDNDFDLSLTFPNKGLTIQSFDNTMNFVLLSNMCPLYQSLQVVTTNQMKLSRIAVEHEINNEAFEEMWDVMTTHLKPISSYCICDTYYDHKLSKIKEGTFNCVQAQEYRKCILESTFDNTTFSKDDEFMTRVQKELNLIEAESTKKIVKELCEEQKTIDRHNYLRFVCLIQDVAKNVLVGVLKERLFGSNFGNTLNAMKNRILPLLNGYQEQLLYPDGSQYAGDLSDMDVSLLYIILRNLGTICPHQNGWGRYPEENDSSMSANIDRIYKAKNLLVSHSSNCSLMYAEFIKRWADIRQSCVELGGEQYKEIIDNLLTSTFNSDLEQQFSEKLEKLNEMDVQTGRHNKKLEEMLDSVKEILVNLKKDKAFRERNTGVKYEVNSDNSLPFAGTSEDFHKLLSTGTYETFENRVFLCGSCACGKSTLASVLIGSPIPLTWKSTDGLVIHFGRNGINLETYEMVTLEGDERGQKVLTKVILGNPNRETSECQSSNSHHYQRIASSSTGTDNLKASNDKIWKSKDNLESSDDKIWKSEDVPYTNTITSKKEKVATICLPKFKKIEAYAVHDDILKEIKSGQYKIKIAPSDLVDFGGQRSYDMTHQLFVQHGGTFVVMFDGSRDFHEPLKEYPTGDISNESIVKHWVDSILTYCVDDSDVMPKILFAATHSDLLSEEMQKKIKINLVKKVTDMFGTHERKKHFVFEPVFFINGTEDNDQEIQNLKNKLVSIARNQPSWGVRRPMIWVPLELMISNMKRDNINIILKTRLAEANAMNGDLALSAKQLDDFLLTQHALGKIMYFHQPELNKFIILFPPALVNVLRSFITAELFWPEDETLRKILRNLTDTGKIYKKDLLKLWQQTKFQTHMPDDDFNEFVVQVLTHLDILVLPKRYSGSCDTHVDYYLVPCSIKNKMPMSFLDDESFANRTLSLVYRLKMSSIPSALSLKLIGAVSSVWPIRELNGRPSLYHSSAVLCVDGNTEFRIIVGDTRVIVYLTHKSCKSSISPDIAASIQECLTSTLEVVLKCYLSINGKSNQKANVSDLFEIEIGEVCSRSPCVVSISRAKLNSYWMCNIGNEHFSKYPLIWLFDKTQKECLSTCPGLETKRLTTTPSEKQLSRLADQLDNNSCRELMIHLGLQQKDWKDIEDSYTLPLIRRIMALHNWKTKWIKGKPTKSFGNLLDALTAIGDHRHLLCKVFREDTELIDIADVRLQKVPSDDVLNGLPMNLGNCAIQLGIELGITMSSIEETMVRHHQDMYNQIYDILRKWKCSCEVKPTIYRLMLALERVHIGGLKYLQGVYLGQ